MCSEQRADKILVIAPHADDEILGCGGAMARHVARGDDVYVTVVTTGPSAPKIRAELRVAHELLGVAGTSFLDFPVLKLDVTPGHELADALREVITSLGASTVYMPHRGDIHGDHRAVHLATLVAARPINECPVRRLLCYEALSETEWASPSGDNAFIPTVFMDISEYLPRKLEAMACYASQLKQPPHSRSLETIKALARLRGGTVGVEAAEAFMLVREIEG